VTLERIAATVTVVVVAGGVAAGFAAIGPPSRARALALDSRRIDDLTTIVGMLNDRDGPLPVVFTATPAVPHDPATGAPYVYVREDAGRYRLCATFTNASDADDPIAVWHHPAGPACFRFFRNSNLPAGKAFPPPPPDVR
jgi:hypothetical protein